MTNERGNDQQEQEHDEEEFNWRYDVFLCFRGPDTRHTFTGTLYDALRLKRFRTFMDIHGGLKSGDRISHTLIQAIQSSRVSIVVLSQYFAASSFCLDELVKIIDCRNTKNQLVLPIFYNVDPSDVRHQRNSYEEAMVKHEYRFGNDSERIHLWRLALSEVANLPGYHFKNRCQYEYIVIQEIVEWVAKTVPRFDVFISFGKDTRYSFTGFLLKALRRGGFGTLMNVDEFQDLQEQSSQSTIEAIAKSRFSIIVFSEKYAYSSTCLDELVTILERMKNRKNYMVLPVFYKVEPSDLRHQKNSYGKAMTAHEDLLGKDSEKVQKWRSALSEVANLKGWHLKTGYEYELIEKIVEIAMKI